MIKSLLEKLFSMNQQSNQLEEKISKDEVQAIVDQRIKEHTATLQTSDEKDNKEEYLLTPKQIEYALSLIEKVSNEFILAIDPTKLTVKDLNRLIAYNRYKNRGILVNLVKSGVLRNK